MKINVESLADRLESGSVSTKDLSDAADGLRAFAQFMDRCEAAGFVNKKGDVRKVLGTLVMTADGCIVGQKAVVYWNEDPYEESIETLNTNLAFFEDHAMDATGEPCGNWERIELCYSSRTAAEAARGGEQNGPTLG